MKIFRTLWAIYGILVFFLMWVVFIPFYFLAFLITPKKWRHPIFWFSHHVFTRIFFALTLIFIKVEGLENLDSRRCYILVSNHVSALDFMVNAVAYPGVYKYLAKRELVKVPLFGFIVRKMCVLVDRSSAASRKASIQYLKQTLLEGYSVFLYPEGTRNRSANPLLPFHKGAFKIAIETGTPIAVQTIVGVKSVSGKASGMDLCPGTVKVVWSKPIQVQNLEIKEVDVLIEQVKQEMMRNLSLRVEAVSA
jgi:1-acyl-sn-glycerol-3-phosphate acyltransferase